MALANVVISVFFFSLGTRVILLTCWLGRWEGNAYAPMLWDEFPLCIAPGQWGLYLGWRRQHDVSWKSALPLWDSCCCSCQGQKKEQRDTCHMTEWAFCWRVQAAWLDTAQLPCLLPSVLLPLLPLPWLLSSPLGGKFDSLSSPTPRVGIIATSFACPPGEASQQLSPDKDGFIDPR